LKKENFERFVELIVDKVKSDVTFCVYIMSTPVEKLYYRAVYLFKWIAVA